MLTRVSGVSVSYEFFVFGHIDAAMCLGQYVYLVPEYTSDRSQAAHAFSLLTTYQEDLCAADMSRGDGKELYRYLCAFYNGSDDSRITKVWLSRTEDTKEGDGRTADLNRNRGGDFLYLCWESEINDDGGNAAPAALSYSKEDDIRGLLGKCLLVG